MSEKIVGIYPPYDKLINNPRTPWAGLAVHSAEHYTYRPQVKPLNNGQLETVCSRLAEDKKKRLDMLKGIRNNTQDLLARSSTVGIVLEGRSPGYSQGWLGDMVEASRLVSPLRSEGKKVAIFTSNPDVFNGTPDDGVSVITIPESTSTQGNIRYPWNPDFRRFAHDKANAFFFPTNAQIPTLVTLDEQGNISNQDHLDLFKAAVQPQSNYYGIGVRRWAHQGIHQLHALQFCGHLIGLSNVGEWTDFPNAYIHPAKKDAEIAQQVIDYYGCLGGCEEPGINPLFLHPGVATDSEKLLTKFYPEDKWKATLEKMIDLGTAINPMVLLKPVDPVQSRIALRIAKSARGLGLRVNEVPMDKIGQQYGWSLGAFASFLGHVADKKGLIVGVDSMPAGHLGPSLGMRSVVLGSGYYNPGFFSPQKDALVVMPCAGLMTSDINHEHAAHALHDAQTIFA